jgi:predicted RNA polymerase sigma factor
LAARAPSDALVVPGIDVAAPPAGDDDSLTLLFLCCHPCLSPQSQVALTLRAVGGLTTAEIASAFFAPEATMAQRISRAKQRIRETAVPFELPPDGERAERLQAVLRVLYLVFNEGYTASGGDDLQRPELAAEAIRLCRQLARSLPDDGEVTGLLALMLLTNARRAARTSDDGELIPLGEQDRARWDHDEIAQGVALVSGALTSGPVGPYQLEAAIAAVHDEAPSTSATDWAQVLALYDLLQRIEPGPMVTLNRAIAVAMVRGPSQGLAELAPLDDDERMAGHHRLIATRAHLLEMAGDATAARDAFLLASARTASAPEQRYLAARAHRLSPDALGVEH